VSEARIVRDPRTQESRGFGFVTMAYPDEVDRVLKNLGDAIFEGRRLTVEKVKRHLLH
jgi:transformer-2 protein